MKRRVAAGQGQQAGVVAALGTAVAALSLLASGPAMAQPVPYGVPFFSAEIRDPDRPREYVITTPDRTITYNRPSDSYTGTGALAITSDGRIVFFDPGVENRWFVLDPATSSVPSQICAGSSCPGEGQPVVLERDGFGGRAGDVLILRPSPGSFKIVRLDPNTSANPAGTVLTRSQEITAVGVSPAGALIVAIGQLPARIEVFEEQCPSPTCTLALSATYTDFSSVADIEVDSRGVYYIADIFRGIVVLDPATGGRSTFTLPDADEYSRNPGPLAIDRAAEVLYVGRGVRGSYPTFYWELGRLNLLPTLGGYEPLAINGFLEYSPGDGTNFSEMGGLSVRPSVCTGGTPACSDPTAPPAGPCTIPLGHELSDQSGPRTFCVYVPTRDGGKLKAWIGIGELPQPISISAPDGATLASPSNNEVETEDHGAGWYTVKVDVSGSYALSNTFVQEGVAAQRPWNGMFFPFEQGNNPTWVTMWNPDGPLAYYELAPDPHGLGGATRGSARAWESTYHRGAANWEGHCWGLALAAASGNPFPVPTPGTTPQEFSSQSQVLTDLALTGLLAELATGGDYSFEDLPGIFANIPHEPAAAGPHVAMFHDILVKALRKDRRALVGNLRAKERAGYFFGNESEVWNHAIRSFSSTFEGDARPLIGDPRFATVTTTVRSAENESVAPHDERVDVYRYQVRFVGEGMNVGTIDAEWAGQTWLSAAAMDGTPRYVPRGLGYPDPKWGSADSDPRKSANPHVTKGLVSYLVSGGVQ